MITFEQARTIVADQLASQYPAAADFTVAPWGWETDDVYIVAAGPYARIYKPRNEADYDWLIPADQSSICVDKTTGEITFPVEPPQPSTPCGAANPDLD